MKQKTMTIEQLQAIIDVSNRLRMENKALQTIVNDYAGLMKRENGFPAVIVGVYPDADGAEVAMVVDGVLRVLAADAAGLKEFAIETVHYDSKLLALADRLKRNQGRGKDVTPGERNAWIKMLKQKGMVQADIARSVGLTEASVSRILKGHQGEGNPGLKNKGKTHESRAARGSAGNNVAKGEVSDVPQFFLVLNAIVAVIPKLAEDLLTKSTIADLETVSHAIVELKSLETDLAKALHVSRKRAA